MMKYRIMVEGEDHTLFCTAGGLEEWQVEDNHKEAIIEYPCALDIWVEDES